MVKELENLSYEDTEGVGFLQPGKEEPWGDLIAVLQYLKEACK